MIDKIELNLIPFHCAQAISNAIGHNVNVSFREHFCDLIVGHVEFFLAGKKYEDIVIMYPKDWIQALKERFAPEWVLNQYPVIYTKHEISASRYFPNFKVDIPKDRFGESVFWYSHNERTVRDDREDSN